MAVGLLLIVFSSELFIVTHIHHNCSGKDCPICAEIQLAEALVHTIGGAVAAGAAIVILLRIFKAVLPVSPQVILFNSPVKMKVRMDH
jgi:hypothetical protein